MTLNITREDYPIRTLASGTQLYIPIFRVSAHQPGPHIYIQANIHGPEIAGIGAIYDLMTLIHQHETLNGSLTLVPSVNPVGLDSKVGGYQTGYADLNETVVGNFNRIYAMLVSDTAIDDPKEPHRVALDAFVQQHRDSDLSTIKSAFRAALGAALDDIEAKRAVYGMRHGQKLALIIQRLSYAADDLIDLHTAGDAVYHLFTFAECLPSVRYFDLPYTIQLDDSFSGVLDEAFLQPWLRLRKALAEAGRQIDFADFDLAAFTPELGSADTLSREAMAQDAERVANYLRHRGVLPGEAVRHPGDFVTAAQKHYRRYNAPTGGLLLWHVAAGDRVEAGEPLVTILRAYRMQPQGGTSDATQVQIVAVESGVVITKAESQVVHEGMSLCSVLTRLERVP